MSQKLKVVTIGGGSSYTPELLEGFLKRYHELPVTELWLVDVEEGQEKLDIIHALCERMVEKAGVPMKVYKTLDRRAALQGADFVTTQLRVGQLKAREKDERIPLSHGYLGQETNGAGGLFKGLRTIPVIFDIVKDVQEICPDAWIINFTNPAGMVTEAVYRHTNFKRFIGVCNIPIGMKMFIRDVLAREIPMILRTEIYATACIVGGIVHATAYYTFQVPLENAAMIGMVVTLVIRLAAIRWHLKLPTFALDENGR